MSYRTSSAPPAEPRSRPRLLRGLAAVGAAVFFSAAFMIAPPDAIRGACTLSFEPAEVIAGGEASELRIVPSYVIEPPDSVHFQDESGLSAVLVEERPFHVTVDPAQAGVGEWLVTAYRERIETCTGTLRVVEAG
jgi:hypothetical protein